MSSTCVLAIGVFDLFHRGHLEFLRKAKAVGDRLLVVVNGDALTESYKRRPIIPAADRLEIVRACRYVDAAWVSESRDIRPYIIEHHISVVMHGNDWPHASYMEQVCISEAFAADKGLQFRYTPYYSGESTSAILARIRAQEA